MLVEIVVIFLRVIGMRERLHDFRVVEVILLDSPWRVVP